MKRKNTRKKIIPFLILITAAVLAVLIILLTWRSNARKIFVDYGMEVVIVQEESTYTAVVSSIPSTGDVSEILLTILNGNKIDHYKLFKGHVWAYIQNKKYFILNGTEDSILIFNTVNGETRYIQTLGELHYLVNETLCLAYPGMDVWEFEIINLKDGTSRIEDDHYQAPARASTPVYPEESSLSTEKRLEYTKLLSKPGMVLKK